MTGRRVGVFGGTFDPIHTGHLIVAEEVKQSLALERVLFVPNGVPPHKPQRAVASAEDRAKMVGLAVTSNDGFALDRTELDREGPSYAVDTMHALRDRFGPDMRLSFVLGADALRELSAWSRPDQLLAEFDLIVMNRAGTSSDQSLSNLTDRFPSIGERVVQVDVPAIAISSSDVRQRVATGRTIRYLVPESVEEFIQMRGLYR